MKKIISLLCLVGCGSDTDPTLEGTWYREDGRLDCVYFLHLEPNRYEHWSVCTLSSGELGAEVDMGSYGVEQGSLTFYPDRGSCSGNLERDDSLNSISVSYTFVDKNHLELDNSTGLDVYERLGDTGSSGTGSITFGCFDNDGIFESNPIDNY